MSLIRKSDPCFEDDAQINSNADSTSLALNTGLMTSTYAGNTKKSTASAVAFAG